MKSKRDVRTAACFVGGRYRSGSATFQLKDLRRCANLFCDSPHVKLVRAKGEKHSLSLISSSVFFYMAKVLRSLLLSVYGALTLIISVVFCQAGVIPGTSLMFSLAQSWLPVSTQFKSIVISAVLLSVPISVEAFNIFNYSTCEESVLATYNTTPSDILLRDRNGQPTSNLSEAWGISYETCAQICTASAEFITWNSFSTQFGSWLLPWLALTSQLPFETRSKSMNWQSLLLGLGSPLLIIYSLAITILNARAINKETRQLYEDNDELQRPLQIEVIQAARVLLIEGQSVPLQVVNGQDREFAQLICHPANAGWWTSTANEVLKTRKEWTYALVAQLIMVIIAQIFSIVDFITYPADQDTISVGLGINSLWIWMIPVAFGWVKVGTQTSAGSIKAALKAIPVPAFKTRANFAKKSVGIHDRTQYAASVGRRSAPPFRFGTNRSLREAADSFSLAEMLPLQGFGEDRPILMRTEFGDGQDVNHPTSPPSALDERSQVESASKNQSGEIVEETGSFQTQNEEAQDGDHDNLDLAAHGRETFLGFPINGDDAEPGPLFNYARIWAHMNAVATVVGALQRLTEQQKDEKRVDGTTWNADDLDSNLEGTPEEMSKYVFGKDIEHLKVYSQALAVVREACLKAALVAVVLGWGTIGAGLLIAYK